MEFSRIIQCFLPQPQSQQQTTISASSKVEYIIRLPSTCKLLCLSYRSVSKRNAFLVRSTRWPHFEMSDYYSGIEESEITIKNGGSVLSTNASTSFSCTAMNLVIRCRRVPAERIPELRGFWENTWWHGQEVVMNEAAQTTTFPTSGTSNNIQLTNFNDQDISRITVPNIFENTKRYYLLSSCCEIIYINQCWLFQFFGTKQYHDRYHLCPGWNAGKVEITTLMFSFSHPTVSCIAINDSTRHLDNSAIRDC